MLLPSEALAAAKRTGQRVFVKFFSPSQMWTWLKSKKGVKFPIITLDAEKTLWHNVESSLDERNLARRTKQAASILRSSLKAAGLDNEEALGGKLQVLGDRGFFMRVPTVEGGTEALPVRFFELDEVSRKAIRE